MCHKNEKLENQKVWDMEQKLRISFGGEEEVIVNNFGNLEGRDKMKLTKIKEDVGLGQEKVSL